MSKTLNNIIRFQGPETVWKNNIASGLWADDLVFGLVTDNATGKVSKRFYSGKNSRNIDFEYKNAITVDSKIYADSLVTDDNIGLLITIINESNVNENGTYVVTYNINKEIELLKIGDGGRESTTIYPVLAAKEVGYIKVGDEIPPGKTLQDIVDMIFTKILGLATNSTNPSVSLSGLNGRAYEINYTFTEPITVTATFNDGHWNNEDGWLKDGHSYQNFGTVAETYTFSGMKNVEAQQNNQITIENYTVIPGQQKINVLVNHAASVNIPVNQNGVQLNVGNVNNSTTYKEYQSGQVSSVSEIITGVYRYWIGHTSVAPENLDRTVLNSNNFICQKTDLATTNTISYTPEFITPKYSYITIVVPSEYTLNEAFIEAFNAASTFSVTTIQNIGLDSQKSYKVYTLKVESADNIKIKQIKLTK